MQDKQQIIDSFGRIHDYLRISLTDHCNLRCFYCMPEEGIDYLPAAAQMQKDEIIEIASVFVKLGVKKIRLTGGEPLVRKDAGEIINGLSELGVELRITTNGVILDRYFDILTEAGIKSINVSLDSLDQAKAAFISRRDYFSRIMENIQAALQMNFTVKLNVVLIKGVNDNEIAEFVRLTKNPGIVVKFIEFMPFKGNKWDWEKGVSEQEIMDTVQRDLGPIDSMSRSIHSTSNSFRVVGYEGHFEIVSTITNPFCSDCNRIRLTSDGKMKNCLFASSETDLLTSFRNAENLEPIILEAIKTKKHTRDGMTMEMKPDQAEQNRSMISIGG